MMEGKKKSLKTFCHTVAHTKEVCENMPNMHPLQKEIE